jgi:Family of unknown function (DUF6064)
MPAAPPTPGAGVEAFWQMIAGYNATYWPLQIVAFVLGVAVVGLAAWHPRGSGGAISAILAGFWVWVGVVFNVTYFARVSRMAVALAVLFVIEAVILIWSDAVSRRLGFRIRADAYGVVGGVLVFYAMVGYLGLEYLLGRVYPRSLPFGMVPCPTAIFTLGVLLWSRPRLPRSVLVIPTVYALTGVIPVSKGLVEDVGLVVAGVLAACMMVLRDRRPTRVFAAGRGIVGPAGEGSEASR